MFMNKYIVFLISCLFSTTSFSQQLKVEYYENKIIKDLNGLKQLPPSVQKDFEPNRFAYTLIYIDGYSMYENVDFSTLTDAEEETVEEILDFGDGEQVTFIGTSISDPKRYKIFEKKFFKDYLNRKVYAELFTNEAKQVVDVFFEWNWEITNEEKEINGYLCKKAISNLNGYHFEAWYTEEIPVSIGPEKFDGLPGLILYVKTGAIEIVAKSIKSIDSSITIKQPVFAGKTHTFDQIYQRNDLKSIQFKPTIERNRNSNTIKRTTIIR